MNTKAFTTQLFLVSVLSLAIVYSLSLLPFFAHTLSFSMVSLLFFIALTSAIFVLGQKASASSNKNLLTQLIMALVFIKLVFCLILVITYTKLFNPQDNHFIIPFIVIYIIFTIFEVIVLSKVNRQYL